MCVHTVIGMGELTIGGLLVRRATGVAQVARSAAQAVSLIWWAVAATMAATPRLMWVFNQAYLL